MPSRLPGTGHRDHASRSAAAPGCRRCPRSGRLRTVPGTSDTQVKDREVHGRGSRPPRPGVRRFRARAPRGGGPGTPGCDRYCSRGRATAAGATVDAVSIEDIAVATRTDPATRGTTVVGRARERARLEQEVRRLRAGQSAVLVLRGGPGIGKTALLDVAARGAQGCRVVRARGVESEMQFPHAGLQLLCGPLLEHLAHLQ